MKLIFIDWKCFGREDLLETFKLLGHTVVRFARGEADNVKFDLEYIESLSKKIEVENIRLVFSMNYYPSVSEACHKKGVPYISWIYDNPYSKMFCINIINECNYIFTFNHYTYLELLKKGIKTVYYAPLAANTKRLDNIYLSSTERKVFGADVSFVGAFYNEKNEENFYRRLSGELDKSGAKRTLGFLDAIIESQTKVYGDNFLEHCLTEAVQQDIQTVFPYQNSEFTYFTTIPYMYSSYTLSKRVTELERKRLLYALSNQFEVKVFTNPNNVNPGNCIMRGTVEHFSACPKVFKASKINLNITLRSIETGIPLRAMDIMGAGGFLMTNYQEDFMLHFEPDKDFVFYECEEDLLEKTAYYLKHESEREKVAGSGHERVATDHTYLKRVSEMLAIAVKE